MKIFVPGLFLMVFSMPAMAASSLDVALKNVALSCGAISEELSDMKVRAGIGTAVSAVGTATGAVAVGAGIAKAGVDSDVADLEAELAKLKAMDTGDYTRLSLTEAQISSLNAEISAYVSSSAAQIQDKESEMSELEQKSKKLGNIRTGTLAASTAANIAGAVVAGNNRTTGGLQQKISACIESVSELSRVRMQARLDGSADDAQLSRAEKIIAECGAWETVNVSSIDKRAQGATVASGVGAGLGLIGTITSASANSDKVRDGDDKKEQNLNTASNVLAGGTTLASGAATVFNATQISAIKRAAQVADACEGALK